MASLVLVRHGESRWNLSNRFTGWVDVPLSENGVLEAQECAIHCQKYRFDHAFTSRLVRAHETLHIVLSRQGRTGIIQHKGVESTYRPWIQHSNLLRNDDIPVHTNELLNERYYGLLQGMDKKQAERKYGKEKVLRWRRGFDARPPRGESLKEALERVIPFFKKEIFPHVRRGEQVIVSAHGNTLRAIIKHIEGISDEAISDIDLPQAKPVVYQLSKKGWKRIFGEIKLGRPLR